jgi:hypothetical protein
MRHGLSHESASDEYDWTCLTAAVAGSIPGIQIHSFNLNRFPLAVFT